jgi:decaprenyl-phosphate phosphoribosyltransferase
MAKREAPVPAMPGLDVNPAPSPRLKHYVGIARPDHWIKNIFMLPGVAAAFAVVQPGLGPLAGRFVAGLISLCLVASANYTINEYLDSEFDRFHPVKRLRAGAQGLLDGRLVAVQYAVLVVVGLAIAWAVNIPFLLASIALLVMGLIYNVPPIRTKDKAYLDTLSESINNPLRFLLGWFIVAPAYLPPGSALLAYWMGGAFLMGVKRYSEYRGIADPSRAALYRRSFGHYTEQSLLLSSFFYALCSAFFIAVFLIKYRIEFLLTAPLFGLLFTWYLAIGIRKDSAAQAPEKLYREVGFLAFAVLTFVVSVLMFFIDIPFLHGLMEPHVIQFNLTQP